MTNSIETLEAEMMRLSTSDRARLLDKLVASLDIDEAVEDAWRQEARRRDEDIESGAVAELSLEEVLARHRSGG